ncbi:AbgT family transporter [Vibrio breoganii]|uniref:Aminobenzoyl-glutamate transporter n=1 Tax=Vibrio breoganii TaxID=553239 RepID=A0AAP8SVW6_9VIBR|nr:AbgT family transporter [Vibrio breoganii]MDN3717025.1 AbgT family transporter [Vibrio breoganii]NMO72199.1 TIGR00366 family protein [Vibrio breoganii]NMR71261.1 TIGR00366 family protein [Vibrio breoganii]OCH77453.1 aminobenzoyl-glutamate transporter [Vibrio breoganii]OED98123.1 aminobenzoyl-glutamate transporter [Vibrio breoganii ZF-29]
MSNQAANTAPKQGGMDRFLNLIEKAGNKIPDPAILFFWALIIVWVFSALLSNVSFDLINPRTGDPLEITNLLTGDALAHFLANMVTTFTGFAPLGIVLVAMLGVGVADSSGFITTGLKKMLSFTPAKLLTPMLILVAIVSHTAADAGYVLVIPLGGIIFHAAGRHPLAGIAAAFAGVSGGFSANFIPSGIDPLLAGFTQTAANVLDPEYIVNPLANIYFTGLSSVLIVAIGWFVTERIIEPRLNATTKVDEDAEEAPDLGSMTELEAKAFKYAGWSMIAGIALLVFAIMPENSALRSPEGEITAFSAPIMQSIVPLIFILFIIPGIVYGRVVGKFSSSNDVIKSMSDTMNTMGAYMVMSFFCAQFLVAFGQSNIGTMLALYGAEGLKAMNLPGEATVVGMILLTAMVNLLVGSASAKWALIGPILVPMLMAVGISPELSQAAYRVGDSVSNIISPLMVFFPLVVVYCQRYVKNTGIGTLASLMMPFSIAMLIGWTIFLLAYWALGIPLGIQAPYTYTM